MPIQTHNLPAAAVSRPPCEDADFGPVKLSQADVDYLEYLADQRLRICLVFDPVQGARLRDAAKD